MLELKVTGCETGRECSLLRRRLRRLMVRTAAVLAAAAFLASCVDARMAGEQDAATPDTFAEMLEMLWAFKALPSSTDPTIIITDPMDLISVDEQVPVTPVVVTFTILNWNYPDADNLVYVYLDDVLIDQVGAGNSVVVDDVPFGMHVVALVLMEKNGAVYEKLDNEESRAMIRVKVIKSCSGLGSEGNAECDEGNPCSVGHCVGTQGGYQCGYGHDGGCCYSVYECPVNWLCEEAKCVQCIEGLLQDIRSINRFIRNTPGKTKPQGKRHA